MSCIDEVRCSESGINTQFLYPPSSGTTKFFFLQKRYDSNSLLSFAGLFSFFQILLSKQENSAKLLCKRKYNKSVQVYFDCTTKVRLENELVQSYQKTNKQAL